MSTHAQKTGLLVVNLGTPDAPDPASVRRYLKEFLADPRVIDINPIARWLLLNLIILPFRPAKSSAAYEKIWSDEGSPLLIHGRALVEAIAGALPELEVVLAMRYGNPSIPSGLNELRARGCDRLVIFPLYPHYAASSTGSTLEAIYSNLAQEWNTPYLTVVPPFYDHPDFIESLVAVGQPILDELEPDHIVFSYHGLPERHMVKSDESGRHCLVRSDCCDQLGAANRNCYRAQCVATSNALSKKLGLSTDQWTMCFQSRLGRTPWIKPETEETLTRLAREGVRRVAVFCPAFTADCLETLEEITIRANEVFTEAGGEKLLLVPGLNSTERWIEGCIRLVGESLGQDLVKTSEVEPVVLS